MALPADKLWCFVASFEVVLIESAQQPFANPKHLNLRKIWPSRRNHCRQRSVPQSILMCSLLELSDEEGFDNTIVLKEMRMAESLMEIDSMLDVALALSS
eukprot:6175954-Amphidinium_carterae.1